ncbi:MAG: hypothetical protein WBW33_28005 [Bryobacteraceae bacterium]
MTINLASEPFRRERARNAALVAACSVLSILLITLVSLVFHERGRAAKLRKEIEVQRVELAKYQREQGRFRGILGKPENADVFSESAFLNQLIARRAVSWTMVFDDLQTVLPYNVRLVSVRLPQVAAGDDPASNHIQLDMFVGAEKQEAVIELLQRLEQSPSFGSAALVSQQPPAQNEPYFRFRVSVPYVQKF